MGMLGSCWGENMKPPAPTLMMWTWGKGVGMIGEDGPGQVLVEMPGLRCVVIKMNGRIDGRERDIFAVLRCGLRVFKQQKLNQRPKSLPPGLDTSHACDTL
jgi:hypothetical protein